MSLELSPQQSTELSADYPLDECPIRAPISDIVDMDIKTLAGAELSDNVTGLVANQTTTAGSSGS